MYDSTFYGLTYRGVLVASALICLAACGDDEVWDRSAESGEERDDSSTWLSADPGYGGSGGGEWSGEAGSTEGSGGQDGGSTSSPDDSPSPQTGGGGSSSGSGGSSSGDGSSSGGGGTSSGGSSGGGELGSGEGHIALLTRCVEGYSRPFWMNQFIITGTPGRLSCLAVEDQGVLPAGAGYQYVVVLDRGEVNLEMPSEGYCPVGEYIIEGRPSCQKVTYYNTAAEALDVEGCAAYRSWDEAGTLFYDEPIARSGLVQVEQTSRGCEFHVELHFSNRASLLGSYLIEDTSKEVSCGTSF